MRVCPSCARLFRDGEALCPTDGVFLCSPEDPRTGQVVGNYLFMGRLGRGGMGTVYRGEHRIIGKQVALKVLHRELCGDRQGMERFLAEARAASMIQHPNIVDVTDFGTTPDGSPFFVMEYLNGADLDREISRLGQIPVYRAVNILRQVCRALHACHAVGIVHRDLKPENIVLVRREGHRDLVTLPSDPASQPLVEKEGFWDDVKILDFGVARIHQVTTSLDQETQRQGLVFGSPYYVSPEQAMGQLGDFRSDLYSLGVIFFEMLTGQVPFDGDTPKDVMRMHTQAPAPSLCGLRPDLALPMEAEGLVTRAMSKRPRDRHPSAAAFLKDLERCFGDVIYGRDIQRYLKLRRRRTRELGSAHLAVQAGLGHKREEELGQGKEVGQGGVQDLDQSAVKGVAPEPLFQDTAHEELRSLFRGKYEVPQPVSQTSLRAIARRPKAPPRPDPEQVRSELAGLFDPEEE